jgi:hypothetical protein
MLATSSYNPSTTLNDRNARVQTFGQQLQPLLEQTAQTLAEELVDSTLSEILDGNCPL